MTRSLALKGQSTLSLQDSLDTIWFVEAENIWELAGHLALKSKKSLKAEMRHQWAHENIELKGTLLKFFKTHQTAKRHFSKSIQVPVKLLHKLTQHSTINKEPYKHGRALSTRPELRFYSQIKAYAGGFEF